MFYEHMIICQAMYVTLYLNLFIFSAVKIPQTIGYIDKFDNDQSEM